MKKIVFYSWQSDLPNATNRGFIQTALENAVQTIASDDTVAVEPVVDRDTQGVPGSPDIASTIFGKIAAADVFVADVSIIGKPIENKATPNPNVLIELGYALRGMGFERVILVFNRAFGKIEDLPFDLRMRRLTTYEMPESAAERSPEKRKLEAQLNLAIRSALEGIPAPEAPPALVPSIAAIETQQPNRVLVLRRDLETILVKLISLEPPKARAEGTAEDLLRGIETTQPVVADFSKIAEAIAAMEDEKSAVEIYSWFGKLFEQYENPEEFRGTFMLADQDYFKFLGHELFVTFVAFFIRENRWEMLFRLLDQPIPVRFLQNSGGPGTVNWNYASKHLPFLLDEGKSRGRALLPADVLQARHTTGSLAAILPLEDFMGADFFLLLRAELAPETVEALFVWRPWSCLYLKRTPMFLKAAEQSQVAQRLMNALKVPTIDEFKKRFKARVGKLQGLYGDAFWEFPVSSKDIDRIGTR